jgi:hypothetical protein
LRRDTCSEFDLADGTEFDRSLGSLMVPAFDHDGCHDVVAGFDVGEIVLEEIAALVLPRGDDGNR